MAVRRVNPNIKGERTDESREFYVDVIGLDLAMDMDWILTFVSSSNPTAQLSVIRRDPTAPVHPDVSIEVEDVDAVHAKAVEQKAEIVYGPADEPWGVRRFFVRDPNGAVLNVMTHS